MCSAKKLNIVNHRENKSRASIQEPSQRWRLKYLCHTKSSISVKLAPFSGHQKTKKYTNPYLETIEYKTATKNIVDLDKNLNIFIQAFDEKLLSSSGI